MPLLKVRVTPNARKETVARSAAGVYVVSVKEKPERNAANARVLALIAAQLRIPVKKLRMRTGHRGKTKRIEVLEYTH